MQKLKILIITQDYPPPMGGMQIFTYNLEQELKKSGHNVRVLNFDNRNNNNYKTISFRDFFYTSATSNDYYRLGKLINPNLFSKEGGLRNFVFRNMIYRISKKEISSFNPDIIHVTKNSLYSSIYDCNIPFILSCHSTSKNDIEFALPNIYTIMHARKIHCVSNYLKNVIKERFGIEKSIIKVIYNSIDRYKYRSSNKIKRKKQFITICRMVKWKNVSTLIEAINLLPDTIKKEYKFLFAGDGEEKENLETLVKKLKLKNIRFLGEITNEDQKIKLLQESKYYLLCPTIIDGHTETFGISFIEAQSTGLPVITSMVGGIPEAVGNGGLYVEDETNPQQIADKIEFLINNEDVYQSLLSEIKKRIGQFDKELWFKNILILYSDALTL